MKHKLQTILSLCLVALLASNISIAQILSPQPSSAGSVSSTVGLTDVKIDYFRPKMKGRKIFGEGKDYLQPYGQLWRAGANSGSKITLSTDVEIAGKKVAAGEYLIFATPGASEWSFMLYSDISLGGNVGGYDKAKEVMMATVKSTKLSTPVENLTYNITDISENSTSANIELTWADVSVKVPMTVSFDEAVMASIEKNTQVNAGNYPAAANYYLNSGKDLNKALEWMNTYLAIGKNSEQFWQIHTKAKILAKMGNKKEAIATAKESLEKAKASDRGDFGYIKLNEDFIAGLK
jgi:tetratricopeptide (TPR) repeat protein